MYVSCKRKTNMSDVCYEVVLIAEKAAPGELSIIL